jgi:hypothetical protein
VVAITSAIIVSYLIPVDVSGLGMWRVFCVRYVTSETVVSRR